MGRAEQLHRERLFARLPHHCALAHLGGCSGRLQADHVVDRQWLRQEQGRIRIRAFREPLDPRCRWFIETPLDTLVADDRNGWLLCERHHQLKTVGMMPGVIVLDAMPITVAEFCRAFGIEHALDRFRR